MCAYTLYTFKVNELLDFYVVFFSKANLVQFPETCAILTSFLSCSKLEVSDAFY